MSDWAQLTPAERGQARLRYQEAKQVPPPDRRSRWDAYQALPPEQEAARRPRRRAGGAGQGPTRSRLRSGGTGRATRTQAKSNIVPNPAYSQPPRPIGPTVVQAAPGATTTLDHPPRRRRRRTSRPGCRRSRRRRSSSTSRPCCRSADRRRRPCAPSVQPAAGPSASPRPPAAESPPARDAAPRRRRAARAPSAPPVPDAPHGVLRLRGDDPVRHRRSSRADRRDFRRADRPSPPAERHGAAHLRVRDLRHLLRVVWSRAARRCPCRLGASASRPRRRPPSRARALSATSPAASSGSSRRPWSPRWQLAPWPSLGGSPPASSSTRCRHDRPARQFWHDAAVPDPPRRRARRPPPASALDRVLVELAGADAHHVLDLGDEDLAVADLAGLRGLDDGVDAALGVCSLTTTSTFTFGRKSTTYSAPRYSSVCPFCRPKPFTSVTVSPDTPISASASRTSSSLKGLTMAVICFMAGSG